jgi:thiosulfate dehydrogenase (quinone) large subunit
MKRSDSVLAYTILRLAMGMAMLFHGVARLGHIPAFVESTEKMFAASPLPAGAVRVFASVTPPVELVIGLLVLTGFATRVGLAAGGLWMVLLIFGCTLIEKYDAVGIQLIYSLIFFHLLTNRQFNDISLDLLFFKKSAPSA